MNKLFQPFFAFLLVLITIFSCSEDTLNSAEPPRDYAEQYDVDNDSLIHYLKTHYYNHQDFQSASADEFVDFVIDTIPEGNTSLISLFDQVSTETITIINSDDEAIEHNYYYIIAREGVGESPSVADSVYITYRGNLLSGDVFDQRTTPLWLDSSSNVRGFSDFTSKLKRGTYTENTDGTIDFLNFGAGMVFMPSALGYYSQSSNAVPSYSPLVFAVNLFTYKQTDHDNDGVPSSEEDLNADRYLFNDDTDSDSIPNYMDSDDDGDGTLTKDELDRDENGVYDDTDEDGTPDYLDPNYS
jgi:hypothetical protein